MKKELTVYCVKYGKSPKVFLTIADNSIPLKFVNSYDDVLKSYIFYEFVEVEHLKQIKEICKDTGKTAILNNNHPVGIISEITKLVLGNNVTWKEFSMKAWNKYMRDICSYCCEAHKIVEIDHPIDFKDEKLVEIMSEGNRLEIERKAELDKQYPLLKTLRKRKKKNGK